MLCAFIDFLSVWILEHMHITDIYIIVCIYLKSYLQWYYFGSGSFSLAFSSVFLSMKTDCRDTIHKKAPSIRTLSPPPFNLDIHSELSKNKWTKKCSKQVGQAQCLLENTIIKIPKFLNEWKLLVWNSEIKININVFNMIKDQISYPIPQKYKVIRDIWVGTWPPLF